MMSAENPMGLFARFGHPPIRPMPANRKPAKPLDGTALVQEACRHIRLARNYWDAPATTRPAAASGRRRWHRSSNRPPIDCPEAPRSPRWMRRFSF